MMIQYLLTLVKKTKEEIVSLLESLNVGGNILVGNQLMENDDEYEIKTDRYIAKIFNMSSKGVSKNRNFLTLKSTADYITYLDDDMYYEKDTQDKIEALLELNQYNAVRFNAISDNRNRPIKSLTKRGYVRFRQLSSYGVWGVFYKRQFLLDNNIFFREDIGPGTDINHGEDTLFNKTFLKKSKIYSIPKLAFHVRQIESTWQGENRNLELEMFSHGYLYQLLYPRHSKLMAILFISTHMYCYPKGTDKTFLKSNMFKGIKAAKEKEYRRGGGYRVLILGPVVNDKTSGGVAVFDEGLCNGFKKLGDEVNILSIENSNCLRNISISIHKPNPNKIFFNFGKIAKAIKKYEPDLVISSLQYSLGIKRYKRRWSKAKYVQILHGTPCSINGIFKAWCVNYVARYSKKHFDKLVTVSHLSWAINKKINRVTCDAIINTGCTLNPIKCTNNNRKYDFCYVGRLYRDKNIELMMDAIVELQKENPSIKVCVVGYGEQEALFKSGGKYDLNFIDFKGKLDHDKVSSIYQNSKFFISLCELEACGLAFSEAAINGCNPIAALSSGQTAYFRGKEFYHTVDTSNCSNLANELKHIYANFKIISEDEIKNLQQLFSFSNIAKRYKKLFNMDGNNETIS